MRAQLIDLQQQPKEFEEFSAGEKHAEVESVESAKANAVLLFAAACQVHLKLLDLWLLGIKINSITNKLDSRLYKFL